MELIISFLQTTQKAHQKILFFHDFLKEISEDLDLE